MSKLLDSNRELSYGSVIADALRHYESLCPHHSTITAVAIKTGINSKKLERAIKNEAELTITEFGNVMHVCCFPEGFDLLRTFNFPQLKS